MSRPRKTPKIVGYWTKEQAADVMGACTRTLDRMHAHRNGPPRLKLGGRILYRERSFMLWLEAQEVVYGKLHGRRRR